jgi:NADH:ubiquinone oxidoreductase subunit C
MVPEDVIVDELNNLFGEKIMETKVKKRQIFAKVKLDSYKEIIRYLFKNRGIYHLQTITCTELIEGIEVMAHMGIDFTISIRTTLDKNNPSVPSLYDLIPGAEFYEREIHDLLGVSFEGNPNLGRFILPEDWPQGIYPLRKSFETKSNLPLREGVE